MAQKAIQKVEKGGKTKDDGKTQNKTKRTRKAKTA